MVQRAGELAPDWERGFRALVEALVEALPEVRVHGIKAGLHVTVQLLPGDRAREIRDEAARRGVALTAMSDYYLEPHEDSSMLLLGYGRSSEAVIRAGVRELAAAVRAVRGAHGAYSATMSSSLQPLGSG